MQVPELKFKNFVQPFTPIIDKNFTLRASFGYMKWLDFIMTEGDYIRLSVRFHWIYHAPRGGSPFSHLRILARACGVPVCRRSGGRLAMMLVATINVLIFHLFCQAI